MEFIVYSISISLLYIYSGIGLTFLFCPRSLEKYSLYISPFVGLSYLSFATWYIAHFDIGGTDIYARLLLLPPIIFLIISMIVKKKRSELFWPFWRENISLLFICIIIFTGISVPYLLRVNGLNAMTLGNNDIANYAAASKFMTKFSIPFIDKDGNQIENQFFSKDCHDISCIPQLVDSTYFGAFLSTAIPSSIFSIEPYKLQNIIIYIFFIFSLPIIFLIGTELFKYNKSMSIIITVLSGINFHLLYITYHGFLGQIIGTGMYLSIFFITFYAIFNCDKLSCFFSYIPLSTILTFGLIISYSSLVYLFFVPLFIYVLLVFIFKRSVSRLKNTLIFLVLILTLTFIISPVPFINAIKLSFFMTNGIMGWDMSILSLDWIFGFVGNNIMMQPIPIVYRVITSIPIILIIVLSFIHLFRREYRLFWLSVSYVSFILLLYIFLISKEVYSPSFTGEGYKAYKIVTYFIPIILLSSLSYFRNFHISSITKIKTQILGLAFLTLLIAGNIWSASAMIYTNYQSSIQIKENIIDLQKIAKLDNISSINIAETAYWDQMWIYYFLFLDKRLYLQKSTYYIREPLIGEWTLLKNDNNDIITVSGPRHDIIDINNNYYLTKYYPIVTTLDNNWYDTESNKNTKWRWTNDNPIIELNVRKEDLFIDIYLNYGSLDDNNTFSIFLDDKKIKDCEKNSCYVSNIFISKGTHEMIFKNKLPARLSGNGDPRKLSFAFSVINVMINN